MSEKKLVCHGALCKCQFGMTPDSLVVLSQKKVYINDSAGSQKLVATDKELGMPFQAKTFGQCKLQPTTGGFLPCVPSITGWTGFFEKTQIKSNQGYPLVEDSKATCAIAGSPCVEITFHGQTAAPSSQNVDNADEEVLAQVLPQVNINEIKYPSPYDGVSVSSEETNAQSNSNQEEEEKEIAVAVSVVKDTFVPLGIVAFNGNQENDAIKFNIEVKDNDAERMLVEIRKNGSTHFSEEITEGELLSVGKSEWKWDGFSNSENLNTKELRENEFDIKVAVWLEGNEQSDTKKIGKFKQDEVKWVDVDIQRNIKQITATLVVNLKEGKEKGTELDCRNNATRNSPPAKENCPWDAISEEALKFYGRLPIKKRTKVFSELKDLVFEGINTYWSRNKKRDDGISINGENWDVIVKAEEGTDSMPTPRIDYITNAKPGRSRNWELSRIIFFNEGYLKIGKKWYWREKQKAIEDFKHTAAHEIGHEILLDYGGHGYSKKHKGTSTVFQNEVPNTPYPIKGEIDLMKYSDDQFYPKDYYARSVAAEKDVLSLIWLTKLKI